MFVSESYTMRGRGCTNHLLRYARHISPAVYLFCHRRSTI